MLLASRHWPRYVYIASALLISVAIAAAWISADRAALRLQLELAERNRALQVELARNAMEEGFIRLLEENKILATYSFPEHERGARSDASMLALFETELDAYKESLAYCYLDGPGSVKFLRARPGTESVQEQLRSSASSIWDGFLGPGEAVVINGLGRAPEPYFMFFYPVYLGDEMVGALGTAVGLGRAIDKYLRPLGDSPGRRSFLMFGAGRILWASDDASPSLFALDGNSLMTSRTFAIGDGEFTIIADELRSSLLADLQAVEQPRILALAAGSFLLFAALFVANALYLGQRKRLALAQEERRLSERVAERERELRDSELRYARLFEEAVDGIVIVDETFVISGCNPAAAALFGLPEERLVGSDPLSLSPERQPDGRLSSEAIAEVLERIRSGGALVFEWVHRRGERETFDAEVSVSPIRFGERVAYQAFIRDVTERRRAEGMLRRALDDREILLRELHHRVKNNFQFLESLIELQKGVEPEEAAEALAKIQARTAALAAAYLVTAEKPDSLKVDVRDYLGVLTAQVCDTAFVGSRFDTAIDCDDLPLSLDLAVSLGLLFHELVENAVRHGYGDSGGGALSIGFKRDGNEAILTVRDYGRGLPSGMADGLGLTIVRALAQQLNGVLRLERAEPGTDAEIRFPLA